MFVFVLFANYASLKQDKLLVKFINLTEWSPELHTVQQTDSQDTIVVITSATPTI